MFVVHICLDLFTLCLDKVEQRGWQKNVVVKTVNLVEAIKQKEWRDPSNDLLFIKDPLLFLFFTTGK